MMQKKNLPKNHFLYQKEFNTNQNNFFHSLYEKRKKIIKKPCYSLKD